MMVKLTSKGPILYVSDRIGANNTHFNMLKFRTMRTDTPQVATHLLDDPDQFLTPIGAFLRKTSLDELPQLLNVLKGDMSLVGPRPTSFAADTYELWQSERLDVKPGLTGLWQIIGRGSTDFDERLRLDVAYIERRCWSLDLEILLRTFLSVFSQRGVH